VDLGGVVRPELLCVLQPGDPAEQPLAVRVRDQEVLSEPDRLAVPRRDERFQRRLVRVLRDPEPLRDGDDAEPDVLAGRLHVVRGEPAVGCVLAITVDRILVGAVGCVLAVALGSAASSGRRIGGGVSPPSPSSSPNSVKSSSVMADPPPPTPKAFPLVVQRGCVLSDF